MGTLLLDITVDFKATVCKQFASTIFADLLQRISPGQTSRKEPFTLRIRVRRQPPLFPPETWNVFDATVSNTQRKLIQTMKLRLGTTRSHDRLATVTRLCTAYWTTSGRTPLSCTLLWKRRHVDSRRKKRVRRATRELQERLQNMWIARRDDLLQRWQ